MFPAGDTPEKKRHPTPGKSSLKVLSHDVGSCVSLGRRRFHAAGHRPKPRQRLPTSCEWPFPLESPPKNRIRPPGKVV